MDINIAIQNAAFIMFGWIAGSITILYIVKGFADRDKEDKEN